MLTSVAQNLLRGPLVVQFITKISYKIDSSQPILLRHFDQNLAMFVSWVTCHFMECLSNQVKRGASIAEWLRWTAEYILDKLVVSH